MHFQLISAKIETAMLMSPFDTDSTLFMHWDGEHFPNYN